MGRKETIGYEQTKKGERGRGGFVRLRDPNLRKQ